MKDFSLKLFSILLVVMLFSCSKDRDFPTPPPNEDPVPVDTALQRTFRLVFDQVPAQPDVLANLSAIVTIRNSQNVVVVADKVVAIEYNQKYRSAVITLGKGNYTITSLLIRQGSGANPSISTVRFAGPLAGSAKAAQVTRPLPVPIQLEEKAEKIIPIEVLPVSNTDLPQSFGYADGSFGDRQDDPVALDKQILLRPMVKIGDIIYDSIPVHLVMRRWDSLQNITYSSVYLSAGLQKLVLPAGTVKVQLSVSKWGTQDEITLNWEEIKEDSIYTIGGTAAAKQLKTVFESKIVTGRTTPITKSEFSYRPNGELSEVLVWGKKEDNTTYLIRKDQFGYQNSRITNINSYGEDGSLQGSSVFGYNAEGRVSSIDVMKGTERTTGNVNYIPLETHSGITRDYRIEAAYTHEHHGFITYYNKTMRGGSVSLDQVITSHGNLEEGRYEYDFNINPYAHLGIPDIYLSHYVKHNKKAQSKTWYAVYPEYEPVSFSYTYDADGYPTQLLTKYQSYRTKEEAFTMKTVFVY